MSALAPGLVRCDWPLGHAAPGELTHGGMPEPCKKITSNVQLRALQRGLGPTVFTVAAWAPI